MAEHAATVTWHLAPRAEFSAQNYNQDHEWTFPGGEVVPASSSPHYNGTATRVNPEEAVIAALSSCHMLTFLALAAKKQLRVLSYLDRASGTLGKNDAGKMSLTEITLRPRVVFADEASPCLLSRGNVRITFTGSVGPCRFRPSGCKSLPSTGRVAGSFLLSDGKNTS